MKWKLLSMNEAIARIYNTSTRTTSFPSQNAAPCSFESRYWLLETPTDTAILLLRHAGELLVTMRPVRRVDSSEKYD